MFKQAVKILYIPCRTPYRRVAIEPLHLHLLGYQYLSLYQVLQAFFLIQTACLVVWFRRILVISLLREVRRPWNIPNAKVEDTVTVQADRSHLDILEFRSLVNVLMVIVNKWEYYPKLWCFASCDMMGCTIVYVIRNKAMRVIAQNGRVIPDGPIGCVKAYAWKDTEKWT